MSTTPTPSPCPRCHGTGYLRHIFYRADPPCPDCNPNGEADAARRAASDAATADFYDPAARAARAAARRARREAR